MTNRSSQILKAIKSVWFAHSAPSSFTKYNFSKPFSVMVAAERQTSAVAAFGDLSKTILRRHDNITKSSEDKREYRGLELSNGLKMLLISDPLTDKSAASMDVNVGHMMDPLELPGLAHFCEHMLFLGTDKYPSENEYGKYISSHGGMTNAFTASDHTNYFFDIAPDYLIGALDRFVQFFFAPQFTESATEREVCAVDSEFRNNLYNDEWRLLQLERSLSKANHDYSKFGVGSKQTLSIDAVKKNIEPRKALLDFHRRYYSSNIMSCCILGKESLDELEKMIESLEFAKIEKKNVSRKIWKESPYSSEELAAKVEVVPVKDLRNLSLLFPMADYKDEYKSQPAHYVAHLIGHEGPGSLLSELKRRGWVNSLSAGDRVLGRGMSCFQITVDLSEDGLLHTDNIVELIFNEIGLVKNAGPLKWVHDELRQLAEIKFHFKDKETPSTYATRLASELQRVPFEDVVSADYLIEHYKPELIKEVLEQLKPENMIFTVVSQKFAGKSDNLIEKWYGTEYNRAHLNKEFISKCSNALTSKPPFLCLPDKNEYIASNFNLKPREVERDAPVLVHCDAWSRLWFMQDNEYKLPKQVTKLVVQSPMMHADPLNYYLSAMFIICLQDALAEQTYNPYLAGLSTSFDLNSRGITLRVMGYDEKQAKFVNNLIHRMVHFVPDKERYDVLKESFCRGLRNFKQMQPYIQGSYYCGLLLAGRQWSKEQILACAENCHVEMLRKFIRRSLRSVHIEALVYGNATIEESVEMIEEVQKQFKEVTESRPLFENEFEQNREYEIPKGSSFAFKACQPTHPNSSIIYIAQTGVQNVRENVLLELIVQLAAEPSFNQLRTNEQLGYIVQTYTRRSHGVQGLQILIQGQHDPEFMEERIEAFLLKFRSDLEAMPEQEFKDNVEALASKRLEKPKTMNAKAGHFWNEIYEGFYHFNRELTEVPILRSLTKDDVLQFFDKHFAVGSGERRKLCTMVYANTDNEESVVEKDRVKRSASGDQNQTSELIGDITVFKSRLPMYPLPQPAVDINKPYKK